MDRTLRNLRLIVRAQSALLEARLGEVGWQIALLVVAGVAVLFGLAMLDVAGFLALEPQIGPGWAALAVAVGNFGIAGLLALLALRPARSPATRRAREARDLALADLEATLGQAGAEAAGLRAALPGPAGGLQAAALGALLRSLRRRLRRRRPKTRAD